MKAKQVQLFFMEWAKSHGYTHKVAGDNAYSSKPMGMGKYAKLISAKGGTILVATEDGRVEITPIDKENG